MVQQFTGLRDGGCVSKKDFLAYIISPGRLIGLMENKSSIPIRKQAFQLHCMVRLSSVRQSMLRGDKGTRGVVVVVLYY